MKQSYGEMCRILDKYYKTDNYCSIIALCVCCNVSIGKAYHTMKRAGFVDEKGAKFHMLCTGIKALGYKQKEVDKVYNKEVKSITKLLPSEGCFMVHTDTHVLAVRHGKVIDKIDGQSNRIIAAYEIIKI